MGTIHGNHTCALNQKGPPNSIAEVAITQELKAHRTTDLGTHRMVIMGDPSPTDPIVISKMGDQMGCRDQIATIRQPTMVQDPVMDITLTELDTHEQHPNRIPAMLKVFTPLLETSNHTKL
jgi:hypothetical protein